MPRSRPALLYLSLTMSVLPIAAESATPKRTSTKTKVTVKRERCPALKGKRRVKLDLKPSTSLAELVAWVSSMTCKRFILADALASQRVTLLSPAPLTAGEAYQAFLSALEVMGLTVIPVGRSYKIAPASTAVGAPVPTLLDRKKIDAGKLPAGEQVVTQLIQPVHADARQLTGVAQVLKSRHGHVTLYAPSNTLIITDSASNVRRLVRILGRLDTAEGGHEVRVRRLEHAEAGELAGLLGELFVKGASAPGKTGKGSAGGRGHAPKVLVDRGTNALVITADEETHAKMMRLVDKLDVAGDGARPQVWVHRLEHGDAEQLAKTVGGMQLNVGRAGSTASRGRSKRGKAASGARGALFDGEVKVNADKANNALVIVATARDYLGLRRVIKQLDRPRRQVFIEAYVLEIKLRRARDVGAAFHGATQVGEGDEQTTLLAGLSHGTNFNSYLLNPLSLMGMAVGVQGPALPGYEASSGDGESDGASISIPAFGVVLRALATSQDIDVLSSPHLLTTDNEEAELRVGQRIPVVTGTQGPTTGNAQANLLLSLGQRVERENVGLSLKLTPTIGEGDAIRLALEQEASSVAKENFGELGASTYERLIKTVVTVKDRQTVVIGGLISESVEEEESKVPLLGDIPIIGRLFRRTGRSLQKTNLMVVLTPYIVRDQGDLRRIFRRKLADRREFIRRYAALQQQGKRLSAPMYFRFKRGLLSEINRVGARLEARPSPDRVRKLPRAAASAPPLPTRPHGISHPSVRRSAGMALE